MISINNTLIPTLGEDSFTLFGQPFTPQIVSTWTKSHWEIPMYSVAFYLLATFSLQKYMESRKPFELRKTLIAWNIFLAAFSIFCTYKGIIEIAKVLTTDGIHAVVCYNNYLRTNATNVFCSWLFVWSKIVEFGDTAFIVLRKKKLIFLHWYHHVTVLLLTWYSFADYASTTQLYGPINASAHSIMYSYFAFQAMKFRIPRLISMFLTSYQIAQMFIGSYVTWYAYRVKTEGSRCDVSNKVLLIAGLIYLSYMYLFLRFFYFAYIHPDTRKRDVSSVKATKVQ